MFFAETYGASAMPTAHTAPTTDSGLTANFSN